MEESVYKYVGSQDYDCIGLVKRLCEVYGLGFPAITSAKAEMVGIDSLRFGDILAFDFHGVGADHLAFYLKDNKFIHHLDTTGVVISNIEHKYFRNRFRGVVIG